MSNWIFRILTITSCLVLSSCLRAPFFAKHKHLMGYGLPKTFAKEDLPPDSWFTQKLDHFSPTNSMTWKQRYFINDEFHDNETPGPVFLMIGGEGEASPEWMKAGQWIEYAKKFKALCFQLEHRYYGKSQPFNDMSTKNLNFLTSEQALADLAYFITSMNKKHRFGRDVKWVVFGGSYPGSLAAWMRLKYPHLVRAAVSSSAPLLAKIDFMEYYIVVVDALRSIGDNCVQAVSEGFKEINSLMDQPEGRVNISRIFRLCDPLDNTNSLDVSSFYESIASNFAGIVQYNKDNRMGKSGILNNVTIDLVCRLMTDESAGTPMNRLSNMNMLLLNIQKEKCLDYKYQKIVDDYRNSTLEKAMEDGGRQWMYQTCNEFGFYQTSSGTSAVFSNEFKIDFFVQQCEDIFGKKFNKTHINEAVYKTNMMYGDLNIQSSKIVFVHGSIDPWHALGITSTKDQYNPAIYIKGTAHCANMYPASDRDLPALKAAREMIAEHLDVWLEN